MIPHETIAPSIARIAHELDALLREREELYEELERLRQRIHNNRPKLGTKEVANIRDMRRGGYTVREIAEVYDVNKSTVSRILRGEYHK